MISEISNSQERNVKENEFRNEIRRKWRLLFFRLDSWIVGMELPRAVNTLVYMYMGLHSVEVIN